MGGRASGSAIHLQGRYTLLEDAHRWHFSILQCVR